MPRFSFSVSSTVPASTSDAPPASPLMVFPRTTGICGPSFAATAGGISAGDAWAHIYQLAYQQAQAALAPSRFQKACAPCWN